MAIDNVARGLALKAIAAGGGGTTYPEVATFSVLPSAAANTGKDYLVQSTTGTWLNPFTRKSAGLYRSNGTSWLWLGDTVSTAGDISNVPAGNIAATDAQSALNELDTKKAAVANNLSDLASASTARTNLGLKTGALVNISVGTVAPGSPATNDLWVDTN